MYRGSPLPSGDPCLVGTGNPNARVPVIGSTVPDTTGEVTTIHAENAEISVRRSLNLVGSPRS